MTARVSGLGALRSRALAGRGSLTLALCGQGPSQWEAEVDTRSGDVLPGDASTPLPGFTSFPKDFPTFWPEGRVWNL